MNLAGYRLRHNRRRYGHQTAHHPPADLSHSWFQNKPNHRGHFGSLSCYPPAHRLISKCLG
ncbi:Uncharacterised protein [Vibrio cholerae]|nr:Uncharacterised protein [Vibrio cholerae]CSI80335.1 Uncharacterised protein [Vibrio cholerae]